MALQWAKEEHVQIYEINWLWSGKMGPHKSVLFAHQGSGSAGFTSRSLSVKALVRPHPNWVSGHEEQLKAEELCAGADAHVLAAFAKNVAMRFDFLPTLESGMPCISHCHSHTRDMHAS